VCVKIAPALQSVNIALRSFSIILLWFFNWLSFWGLKKFIFKQANNFWTNLW